MRVWKVTPQSSRLDLISVLMRLRAGGELRVLRWVYGAVVNATAAQAADRRRELLAGRTADAALLGLYEDIALVWRRLHELGTKKTRLQQLRCATLICNTIAPRSLSLQSHCCSCPSR